jgi:hypothetical protein
MTAVRRLPAIMATDVVGRSRLMAEGGERTARATRECPDTARPKSY